MSRPTETRKGHFPKKGQKSYQHHWTWIICISILAIAYILGIILKKNDISHLIVKYGNDIIFFLAAAGVPALITVAVQGINKLIKE